MLQLNDSCEQMINLEKNHSAFFQSADQSKNDSILQGSPSKNPVDQTGKQSPRKRRKIILPLRELQNIHDNIGQITCTFFKNHNDQAKVLNFRKKYSNWLNGGYMDLVLTIKHFKEFNLFDHIQINVTCSTDLTEKQQKERKKKIYVRNNIFLNVLVEAAQAQLIEKKGEKKSLTGENIFGDLSFLKSHVDTFKNIIIDKENVQNFEYDVEVYFLALLGFVEKAKVIKMKFIGYFKEFLSESNIKTLTIDAFINQTLLKRLFDKYTEEELIVLRKIINNAAKRNFATGIEFLTRDFDYCCILAEGRIWKSIVLNFTPKAISNLWTRYENSLDYLKDLDLRSTIETEYHESLDKIKKTLHLLTGEDETTVKERNLFMLRKIEMEQDIEIDFVRCLSDLINIMFKFDKKELVLFILDEYKFSRKQDAISVEIFEECLEYDEDLSIDALNKVITNDNVHDYYMHLALLKKYFKLAVHLLKFKVCKNFLNAPSSNSEEFLFSMLKHQLKQKKQMNQKFEIEKLKPHGENEKLEEILRRGESKLEEIVINDEDADDTHDMSQSKQNTKFATNVPYKSTRLKETLDEAKIQVIKPKLSSSSHNIVIVERINSENCNEDDFDNISIHQGEALKLKSSQKLICNNGKKEAFNLDIVNRLLVTEQPVCHSDLASPSAKASQTVILGNSVDHKCLDANIVPVSQTIVINRVYSTKKKPAGDLKYASSGQRIEQSCGNSIIQERKGSLKKTLTNSDEIQIENVKNGKSKVNVQLVLVDHLRLGQFAYYIMCLLSSISEKNLNVEYADKICQYLLVFTRDEEAMTRCRHPLLVCALAAEFLNKLGKINPKVQFRCQSVAKLMINLGENIQSAMKDEDMLNYYLKMQTDHIGRNALEINAENRFYELLSNENVGAIVGKLWFGSGNAQSIFIFSRISRIFVSNILHEHYDYIKSVNYLPENSVYSFQYYQYTKNCSMRYMADSISTIITTIIYQLIIYAFVSLSKDNIDSHYDPTFCLFNKIANVVVYSIIVNFLQYLLYIYMTNRKLKVNMIFFIDLILFFAVLANFIYFQKFFLNYAKDYEIIELIDGIIYSVIIICSWMRVIGILIVTYSFGPFLRIMWELIRHVVSFLSIMGGFNIAFAQVFTIFFKESNRDFSGFFTSFITLFDDSFGIYNYDNFSAMKVFAYSLLIAFTTITNVMLLNLIIAVISNLFRDYEPQADAENRAVLVLTYERIKWDDKYGILILLPAPFNLLSFLFVIVLLLLKDDSAKIKANTIFSKISYIVIAIFIFLFMLTTNLLFYPFAIIKSLIHSAYDNHAKITFKKIPIILGVIIVRPLVLLGYIFIDCYLYWTLVYVQPKKEINQRERPKVTRDFIMAMRKVIYDCRYKENKRIISSEDLSTKLGVSNKISQSLMMEKGNSQTSCSGSERNDNQKFIIPKINPKSDVNMNANNANFSLDPSLANQQIIKQTFLYMIDRLADSDRILDLDRALLLLPQRIKYTDHFLENLHFTNMRVFLRGIKKYLFLSDSNNPLYSYRKLQHIVYKLLIKFLLIYTHLTEKEQAAIKMKCAEVNSDQLYNHENIKQDEEQLSEYDDEGDIFNGDGKEQISTTNISGSVSLILEEGKDNWSS